MTSLYMYYNFSFALVERSVCHEPTIFVLINVFTLLAYCLLTTVLVLTLTMDVLYHLLSIANLMPQRHCDDEDYGRIGLSS